VLKSTTENRLGCFDVLRLIAAFMVLWSHQFAMNGIPETGLWGENPGGLGVFIFFAISGYLNTRSLIGGRSWWRFLIRRARRIFPALIGVALFCVLIGAFLTTAGPEFWAKVPDFVFRNSTLMFGIRYVLPGVFEHNPYPGAINGSLWTLPIEIKLYIYLAIIAVIVRYRPALLLAALLAIFIGCLVWFHITSAAVQTAYSQKFAIIFISGAAFALAERRWGLTTAIVASIGLAAATAMTTSAVAWLPSFALAAILLGKMQPPRWLQPPLDISYGVYLFAFPIQQVIAGHGLSFWPSLALSITATTALAILSAIYIEQPALQRPTLRPSPAPTH